MIRYNIRDAILTCAQKLTQVSLIYHTERKTKKWGKKEKPKSEKTDMLRSIGKQFGESVELVLKKICRFYAMLAMHPINN